MHPTIAPSSKKERFLDLMTQFNIGIDIAKKNKDLFGFDKV